MRRWAFGIGVIVGMFLSWSFYGSPAIAEAPTYPIPTVIHVTEREVEP